MGKTALITGASTGIGAAFARAVAERGMNVVLVARDRKRLEAVAGEIQARSHITATVLDADLTHPGGLVRVEETIRAEPELTLLVNSAGFGTVGAFAKSDLASEDREIRLNVLALVRLTHAALGPMTARGEGGIINVSSVQSFVPSPYVATYAATKAFVNSFTESLATEVQDTGVKLQALCPGFTRTEFQERAGMETRRVPGPIWMSAEAVVKASLEALDRGDLFCVPGVHNRAVVGLSKLVPGALARRISRTVIRRTI